MSIHFVCPLGHKLKVPDDRAGKPGKCPVCHQRVFVPQIELDAAEGGVEATEVDLGTAAPSEASEVRASPVLEFEGWATEPEGAAELAQEAVMGREAETRSASPISPAVPSALVAVPSPPPLPANPSPAAEVPPTLASPSTPLGEGRWQTGEARTEEVRRAPVRWLTWQKSDCLEGYAILRPDPRQLEIAYWLASLLPFAAAFCAAPALPHLQFIGAPGWAQFMLCVAVLHLAYAAWLAALPDASTVRIGMYLFAASAAAYLVAAGLCVLSHSPLSSLGLSALRWPAAAWCGLAFVVTSVASGACGWVARYWHP
jgi:hypothetical protein